MRKLIFILLLVCAPCQAKNKVVFFNVKIGDPSFSMEVVLDGKPEGDYADKTKYRVIALSSSLPGGTWKWIDIADLKIKPDNTIDITPTNAVDVKGAAQLMLMVGSDPGVFRTKYEETQAGVKKGTKDTSDVYINLSYSPGINGPQQYSIDTSIGLLFPLDAEAKADYGSLGFLAAVKTDKRATADPDSYRLFGVYQRGLTHKAYWPVQGLLFTWLIGGVEFERQAKNTNFISSPLLDFPIRLRGRINDKKAVVPVLIPELGMEVGNNFGNAVNSSGQGAIARGVLGGNLSLTFNPKLKLFQGIHLTSSYKLRLPAKAEVFTDTTTNASGKTVDVPFLSTKPRHYIKNELGFTLWDPISFTITHEYGAIPPAFRLVDHKVSVGFTLALQQNLRMTTGLTGK
jgi:hypothetical protein